MPRSRKLVSRSTSRVEVVLFSGGRGSGALSAQLVTNPQIALTLAINGYDDGASTGEVRRFLGDCLGPSDFRKNASRLARELRWCPPELIALLDERLPMNCPREAGLAALGFLSGRAAPAGPATELRLPEMVRALEEGTRQAVAARVSRFERELHASGRPFNFSDCSLGNLVFSGSFLEAGRDFNRAVEDYCRLLGLPAGLIENVSDGTNAFLVALDIEGRLLGSEAEIVDAKRRNRIRDIYLIDRPLDASDRARLASASVPVVAQFLQKRSRPVRVNPHLVERLRTADLIIYAPGTQHSSLFPSYLTPGLSAAIAGNLTAIKLLITNIQTDAEIAGSSAVDIIDRAVYYFKEKNRLRTPTPCLITHYLINDPGTPETEKPYVPLGRLDTLEDPRLVRIANYEDGVTGRHDAGKILAPFIESLLARREPPRVAILLHDADSTNKLTQTLLELVRGGIQDVPVAVTVFHDHGEALDPAFLESLPFPVRGASPRRDAVNGLQLIVCSERFDYVILFESSGMYKGEDIVGLASPLVVGRLDAVWGSRRLSVKDIRESYRLRYRHNLALGAASYLGSHLLSLTYLLLYGRYVSDTLSGARAVRASYVIEPEIDLTHKRANQHVLSALLRDRADLLETPVQFFPLSPERVKRTSVIDGLQSLLTIVWWRFKARPAASDPRHREAPRPAAIPEAVRPRDREQPADIASSRP